MGNILQICQPLNREGGRIKLADAKPSLNKAIEAAEKLGIKLAQN